MQSPSGRSPIINTSLSRGRLRVSVCGRIININPISPGLSCERVTPGDTRLSLNDPGLHPRNYRAPGPGSTLTLGTIITSILTIHTKGRKIIRRIKERENQPNGS